MNARQIIAAAADLIRDEDRWTTGVLARSRGGNPVKPTHHHAIKWCPIGAIYKVADVDPIKGVGGRVPHSVCAALCVLQMASAQMHKHSFEHVNDNQGHAAALHIMRRAWTIAKDLRDDDKD